MTGLVFFPNVKSRLQWILASLMAQWVENLPAMQANTCSTGDLGSIPGSGRSPGEGNGNQRAEEPGRLQSMGLQELDATERLNHQWIQPVLPGITAQFLDLLEGDLATFLALYLHGSHSPHGRSVKKVLGKVLPSSIIRSKSTRPRWRQGTPG